MTDPAQALILPAGSDLTVLAEDAEAARGYAERSLSDATRAAYRSDLGVFRNWCEARAASSLCPPAPRP